MSNGLDREDILKLAGVFVAALVAISAFEYLADAVASGTVFGDWLALLSIVVLGALFVALVLQRRWSG